MSEENVEVARQEYEFFNRTGDINWDAYDPDFEWRDFEGAPQPIRRGRDGWKQWVRDIRGAFGDFVLEPQELIDLGGDQVLALIVMKARGTASGIPLQEPFAVLWEVRDGKIARGAIFRSKAEALEAAGLSE